MLDWSVCSPNVWGGQTPFGHRPEEEQCEQESETSCASSGTRDVMQSLNLCYVGC